MSENQLDTIYDATSQAEQQATYDDWAAKYEQDLCAMGYRLPALAAGAFARFVPLETCLLYTSPSPRD